MKKNKSGNDQDRLVFSTDPENLSGLFGSLKLGGQDVPIEDTLDQTNPFHSKLRVTLDRKQRNGKEVTLITGYNGSEEKLSELGTTLKSKCGVGGAVKNGEILLQGNHVEKAIKLLIELGYKQTKRHGG